MNKKQQQALEANFSNNKKSLKLMISTLGEWYDAEHRKASLEEVEFVNSIIPKCCPYCGDGHLCKNGFQTRTRIRIWLCKKCGRKSSPLTGTIFDSRKIPLSEWIEYLIHLFEYHSVSTSASDNKMRNPPDSTGSARSFRSSTDIRMGLSLPARYG